VSARERRRLAAELVAAGRGWLVGAVTWAEWTERSDLLLALLARKETP
jgi:hypothetical protein